MAFHVHTEKEYVDPNDETKTVTYCVTCWDKIVKIEEK